MLVSVTIRIIEIVSMVVVSGYRDEGSVGSGELFDYDSRIIHPVGHLSCYQVGQVVSVERAEVEGWLKGGKSSKGSDRSIGLLLLDSLVLSVVESSTTEAISNSFLV